MMVDHVELFLGDCIVLEMDFLRDLRVLFLEHHSLNLSKEILFFNVIDPTQLFKVNNFLEILGHTFLNNIEHRIIKPKTLGILFQLQLFWYKNMFSLLHVQNEHLFGDLNPSQGTFNIKYMLYAPHPHDQSKVAKNAITQNPIDLKPCLMLKIIQQSQLIKSEKEVEGILLI
jgi:hypothetical protein